MMYRATDPRPTRLSADERRKRDADSKRRARRKGYASRGGLDSLRLERWWFEAVGDPMKTALTGDQALGFFNRVGLPMEILVRVWEMAKRGRKGEPKGLLQHEFEAACCLASVALLGTAGGEAPGASQHATPDAHARKRVGYAQAGMYWKFSAFDLAAAAPTPPQTRHHRRRRQSREPNRPGAKNRVDNDPQRRRPPQGLELRRRRTDPARCAQVCHPRRAPPRLEPTPPTRAHRPFATTSG